MLDTIYLNRKSSIDYKKSSAQTPEVKDRQINYVQYYLEYRLWNSSLRFFRSAASSGSISLRYHLWLSDLSTAIMESSKACLFFVSQGHRP
jgi:hypothetical protein